MVRVGVHEAKRQLSRLVDLAEGGEEVIIQRSRSVADAFGAMRGEIR